MMASKPSYVDVRPKFFGGNSNSSISLRGFLSPRMHVAGERPPELSPLDAFAAQSRLLAQQLEDKSHCEKNNSRLPPCKAASPLNQDQPSYFTPLPLKVSEEVPSSPASPSSGMRTKIEAPINRHLSIHPTVYGPYDGDEDETKIPPIPSLPQFDESKVRSIRPISPEDSEEYIGVKIQQQTPPSPQSSPPCLQIGKNPHGSRSQPNIELTHHKPGQLDIDSNNSTFNNQRVLGTKNINFAHRSPSPYSLSADGSDDDNNLYNKRQSQSDGGFLENAPSSISLPITSHPGRTSSISSDASFSAIRPSNRPSPFNFSRPLTRTSITNELPIKQASPEKNRFLPQSTEDAENTPPSTQSETFSDTSLENSPGPGPSYVYAKYALPRGKTLKRNSAIFQDPSTAQTSLNTTNYHESTPSSPLNQPVTTLGLKPTNFRPIPSPSSEFPRPSTSSSVTSRPLFDPSLAFCDKGLSSNEVISRPKSSTDNSSLQKLKSPNPLGSTADLSATEHVEKAIEYHQAGALNKSTYHLRFAARMSHPTGMLLYALACRHGWGMRPNQREGIAWLRRAADEAGLEVADDEISMQAGKVVDVTQLNNKKAQFALSIYELGVSHMNGWGIEQDKALGLRCFEIAGAWGDADAMAEAGFCYAQGVGCKKDLKKSAKFYRMAEARGINMIGNSWIYKAKYNDDQKSDSHKNEDSKDGRSRSGTSSSKDTAKSSDIPNKSRGRGIFRRSKAT